MRTDFTRFFEDRDGEGLATLLLLELGQPESRLEASVASAGQQMAHLEAHGVDFMAAGEQLEREGIEKFIQPFDDLIAAIEKKKGEVLSQA